MMPARKPASGQSYRIQILLMCGLFACLIAAFTPRAVLAALVGASATSQVTTLGGGGVEYRYTIANTSELGGPNLSAWGMPFFDDADTSFVGGESSIFAPDGWTWIFTELTPTEPDDPLWDYVAADDPKNDTYGAPGSAFDSPPYALVFFTFADSISPQETLGDFGYISPYSGANIPFIAGFDNLQQTIGDPLGPLTPGFPLATFLLPEPSSLALLGFAALGLGLLRRRRARRPALA